MEYEPVRQEELEDLVEGVRLVAQTEDEKTKSPPNRYECEKTDWKACIVTSAINFIIFISFILMKGNRWVYLIQLDKTTTVEFFGSVTASSKLIHALSVLFFTYLAHKIGSVKIPLLIGCFLFIVGSTICIFVEVIDENRKILIFAGWLIAGAASGCITVLRAYTAAVTRPEDRGRAIGMSVTATLIGITIVPLIQMAFTTIDYPGYELIPNVRFHVYSGPIFFSILCNFIAIVFICTFLKELPRNEKAEIVEEEEKSKLSIDYWSGQVQKIKNMELNWSLIVLCWFAKSMFSLSLSCFMLLPMMFQAAYAWTSLKMVQIMSISMTASGVISFVISMVWSILGKRISQSKGVGLAMILNAAMYISTYPYPGVSHHLHPYNSVDDTGCDPEKYSWCETEMATSVWLFLPVQTFFSSCFMPVLFVSIDSTYANILGNIDQNILQGAAMVVEDIVSFVAPLIISSAFSSFGFSAVWATCGVISVSSFFIWILNIPKLKIYEHHRG